MNQYADNSDNIRPVIDWVLTQALADFRLRDLICGIAKRLISADFSLYRLHLTVRLLHPIYAGTALTWIHGKGVEKDSFEPGDDQSEIWLSSPLRYMLENRLFEYRLRIHQGEGLEDYRMIRDLGDKGATDYFAILTPFGDPATAIEREDGVIISWTARGQNGWSDNEIASLRRLQSRLAVVIRLAMRQALAQDVISAYLGSDAGQRVLAGQIHRGDGEDIEAVIWFSDLRASTRLAETLGRKAFLNLLNDFFECTAGTVVKAKGEVLSYIGDSVLAIFPFDKFGGPTEACQVAITAAHQASRHVAELNLQRSISGEEPIGFGIGLHPGTVMFGNVGIANRLQFSVVGSAANEAARIADQCRGFNEEIIVSDKFREFAGGNWRSLGEFELRNVTQPMILFAPE